MTGVRALFHGADKLGKMYGPQEIDLRKQEDVEKAESSPTLEQVITPIWKQLHPRSLPDAPDANPRRRGYR